MVKEKEERGGEEQMSQCGEGEEEGCDWKCTEKRERSFI